MNDIEVWRSDASVMLRTKHGDLIITHEEALELGRQLVGDAYKKPRAEPKRRCWTDEDKEELVRLYKEGMKISDIADRFGVTRGLISVMISKAGLSDRLPRVSERKLRDHAIRKIRNGG